MISSHWTPLFIGIFLLLNRSVFAQTIFSQEEAKQLLRRTLESQEDVVAGECRISGILDKNLKREVIDIVYSFDYSIPAYRLVSEQNEFLRIENFFYDRFRRRSVINRWNLDEVLPTGALGPVFDLRTLGLLLDPTTIRSLDQLDFDSLKARYLQGSDFELADESGLLKITFKDRVEGAHFSSTCHLWVSPETGYKPRRFEVEYPNKRDQILGYTEMEWEQLGEYWTLKKLRISHGEMMPTFELSLEFDWESIDQSTNNETLELKSMVEPGQVAVIAAYTKEGGNAVEVGVISNVVPESNESTTFFSKSRFLFLCGGILATIGVFLLIMRKTRKS